MMDTAGGESGMSVQPIGWRAIVKDYVTLTKPRIISLLLLTTLAPMLIAYDGQRSLLAFLNLIVWTMVGGALAAGGSGAINMYMDRDVDAIMSRTKLRPLPSDRMKPRNALIFGLALNLLAFIILYLAANLLAAVLAMIGTAYYVLVYTRWLKRTSTQNIVIGGAAGAIPPLVGWAAVTGNLNPEAFLMFAIVFYWTPPHFWALALLRRTEYARAGIPMLPVVRGETETKWQILLYSLMMIALTIVMTPLGMAGPLYLVLALALGGIFLRDAYVLYREPGLSSAWRLYKYSLLYLALLFCAMALDNYVMLWIA
jgi:protoheme IX farnesyltransferase